MRMTCLSFALLLGACVGGLREDAPVGVYDFGLAGPADAKSAAAGWVSRTALDVRTAPWLEGQGIDYRLAYDDPLRRSQYTGSRWAASPARLLAQQLRQRLGFAIDSVVADCVLRVELQEFAQVFTAPRASQGVLRSQASLFDGKRRLIESKTFAIERAAPEPDAAGGVQALAQASEELGTQLADWLERIGQESLKDCRPAR